jgi:hypothetical protein
VEKEIGEVEVSMDMTVKNHFLLPHLLHLNHLHSMILVTKRVELSKEKDLK